MQFKIQYINMSVTKILCVVFLAVIAIAAPLTQQEVDAFVRGSNFVPPTATLKDFKQDQGKFIVNYDDKFTTYKFVVGQAQDGKPFILFRHQLTQINLSNNGNQNPIQEINFIPGHPVFQFEPMPIIEVPNPFGPDFNQQMLSGMQRTEGRRHERHGKKGRGFPRGMGRRMGRGMGPRGRGCRINEQEVKLLLKQNLVIFRNSQIKSIQKIGFERGSGILLSINLQNEGKQFNVQAGYMPRWNKLNVMKIEEMTVSQSTQTKKETPVAEQKEELNEEKNIGMQSIIQSFIEKLLIRKSFDTQSIQQPPILVGTQGQPENPTILQFQAPILLGRQGENPTQTPIILGRQGENPTAPILLGKQGQNPTQAPFLLGKQGEVVNEPPFLLGHEQKKTPLLGREGEVENPFRFEEQKSEPVKKVQETKKEQLESEQISDIVTEVMSKLKLKKK